MGFFKRLLGLEDQDQQKTINYVTLNLMTGFSYLEFNMDKILLDGGEDGYILVMDLSDESTELKIVTSICGLTIDDVAEQLKILLSTDMFNGKEIAYDAIVRGDNFSYEIDWRDYGVLVKED